MQDTEPILLSDDDDEDIIEEDDLNEQIMEIDVDEDSVLMSEFNNRKTKKRDKAKEIDDDNFGEFELPKKLVFKEDELVKPAIELASNEKEGLIEKEIEIFSTPSKSASDDNQDELGTEDDKDTPQSIAYSQDEEFTEPEDPITVVRTALEIDRVIHEEQRERIHKEKEEQKQTINMVNLKKVGFESDDEERELLQKYRSTPPPIVDSDPEKLAKEEDEFDVQVLLENLIKKRQEKSIKKEVREELKVIDNQQIAEPDLIYDGEKMLIKVGSDRYKTFIHYLHNNNQQYHFKKPRHHICLSCWQFIGVNQRPKHSSLLHVVLEPSECCTEEQFLKIAQEHEKLLDGTMFVVPFKHYVKEPRYKKASAGYEDAIMLGADEVEPETFPVDTFWEDYQFEHARNSLHVIGSFMDEEEQEAMDMLELQRLKRRQMKFTKSKSKQLLKKKSPLSLVESLHLKAKKLQKQIDLLFEIVVFYLQQIVTLKFNKEISPYLTGTESIKGYASATTKQGLRDEGVKIVEEFIHIIFKMGDDKEYGDFD
ncbi:hypothetical protein FGO68_gene12527 [Halteria grandinella]|uniref:Uncharacterized protein n=1 Tax=Halteria grandinella TaxID=5974 RepID=A0A8J8NUV9_HALGN|nr:hypothetical protein FGO68_gene12527 [Halteria grandinella]